MNWFLTKIPPDDIHSRQTAKQVVGISLVTCATALTLLPFTSSLGMTRAEATWIALTIPITMLPAWLVRWTGSVRLASHIFLLSLTLLITAVSVLLRCKVSPALPGFYVLILAATFLLGSRAGLAWTILSVVAAVVMFLTMEYWLDELVRPSDDYALITILNTLGVFIMVYLFALQYERTKNTAIAELRAANRLTHQMIAQLERASERLSVSSQNFLGSGRHETDGLVARIMAKVRDGRESITRSRQSIDGMIGQYRDIASRVQALHVHSQAIIQVVSAIDRISNRLDIMALNVGIEANQSRTASKQFAILADDMRLLAERVLGETRQIKSALRKVQTQVKEVLDSSASGQELTEESSAKLEDMAASFEEIFTLVGEAEGATEEITADTLAQIDAVRNLVTVAARTE